MPPVVVVALPQLGSVVLVTPIVVGVTCIGVLLVVFVMVRVVLPCVVGARARQQSS